MTDGGGDGADMERRGRRECGSILRRGFSGGDLAKEVERRLIGSWGPEAHRSMIS